MLECSRIDCCYRRPKSGESSGGSNREHRSPRAHPPARALQVLHAGRCAVRDGLYQRLVRGSGARDDALYGRGVYDMKGALAAMMYAIEDLQKLGCEATVELLVVPDEEGEHGAKTGAEVLIGNGHVGDFLITGEPTDFHIGTQAKGVLDLRVTLRGKSAHGSQPWLGKNAALLAYEHYRRVLELPFATERSDLFPYPSVNLARIIGGDVLNRVPHRCIYDLDIRYLPGQDPKEIARQIQSVDLPAEVEILFGREPTYVSRANPYVKTLREVAARHFRGNPVGIQADDRAVRPDRRPQRQEPPGVRLQV